MRHERQLDNSCQQTAGIKNCANAFPYVNGDLFTGRIGRSYLVSVGRLEWTKINPEIFVSIIQAVADDQDRGNVGMHYTSVPNILKVQNPLFLDSNPTTQPPSW